MGYKEWRLACIDAGVRPTEGALNDRPGQGGVTESLLHLLVAHKAFKEDHPHGDQGRRRVEQPRHQVKEVPKKDEEAYYRNVFSLINNDNKTLSLLKIRITISSTLNWNNIAKKTLIVNVG